MVKVIFYAAVIPLVIWTLEALRLDIIFKKNRQIQIKMLYILLAFAISYLVVNCMYDFSFYFRSIL